jgi:hypothetical protein
MPRRNCEERREREGRVVSEQEYSEEAAKRAGRGNAEKWVSKSEESGETLKWEVSEQEWREWRNTEMRSVWARVKRAAKHWNEKWVSKSEESGEALKWEVSEQEWRSENKCWSEKWAELSKRRE